MPDFGIEKAKEVLEQNRQIAENIIGESMDFTQEEHKKHNKVMTSLLRDIDEDKVVW